MSSTGCRKWSKKALRNRVVGVSASRLSIPAPLQRRTNTSIRTETSQLLYRPVNEEYDDYDAGDCGRFCDVLDVFTFLGSLLSSSERVFVAPPTRKPTTMTAKVRNHRVRPVDKNDIPTTNAKVGRTPLLGKKALAKSNQVLPQQAYNMEQLPLDAPLHSYAPRFQGCCPLGHQEVIILL